MADSATYRNLYGVQNLTRALEALSEDVRAEVLGVAVKKAIEPIKIAAKRFAKRSERTGALRASITTKVVVYKQNGKAVGLVGPDRAYYSRGKKVKKLGLLHADARPANYAHLVEYGHHAVAPRKGSSIRKKTASVTGWVAAKPFIRPAVMTTLVQQHTAFAKGIEAGIEKTLRKYERLSEKAS